jgi:arsenate reductase
MSDVVFDVLFLCTGNSARSIMAECALNRHGRGKFKAHSAGSQPKGAVHPMALQLLRQLDYATDDLRSKSWDEFAEPDSPKLDFVFTVCGNAANEVCPVWMGHPMTAHWGVEDPAAFVGPTDQQLAKFREIYLELDRRIRAFVSLPITTLDPSSLQKRLDVIGKDGAGSGTAA